MVATSLISSFNFSRGREEASYTSLFFLILLPSEKTVKLLIYHVVCMRTSFLQFYKCTFSVPVVKWFVRRGCGFPKNKICKPSDVRSRKSSVGSLCEFVCSLLMLNTTHGAHTK